jgi:TonB family protein
MSSEAVFSIFVGAAIKSVAVLGVAWGVALLLRGRSAAARHLVWSAAAAGLLALPFLSASLPALRVPGGTLLPTAIFQTTATENPSIDRVAQPTGHAAPNTTPPARTRLNWRTWVLLLWAAGAAIAMLRLIAGCAAVWRARRRAAPFGDRQMTAELAETLGIRDRVEVLETRAGSMPMTFGVIRPAIFMPSDAAGWTEERRRIVLLHELAHVRRGDVAAHLFARAALTLYWWNPLTWFAWREFLKERERATDDLVLSAGARASDYAGHLLEIARTSHATQSLGGAAIAMARRSQLEGRLVAILDSKVNRNSATRAGGWIAVAIAIAMVAPLAAVRAQDPQTSDDVDAVIRAAVSQRNHEILDTTAKAAEQISHFDTAKKLLESSAQIRADVSGAQSADYGIGLLKLGELEQMRGNRSSAEEFYTRAAQILGDRPEAAEALIFLGTSAAIKASRVALLRNDFSEAETYFERAQQADPAHAGIATMWLASMRQKSADPAGAEALYKNALGVTDANTTEAATIMHVYAQFLREQGRTDEASDLVKSADAIDKAVGKSSVKPLVADGGPYKAGGAVSQPKLLSKIEPSYTEEARVAKLQGTVALTVVIGTDGVAHDAQVVQSLGLGLDGAAISAVSNWKFQPGMKDGAPVEVIATIQVNFRLL